MWKILSLVIRQGFIGHLWKFISLIAIKARLCRPFVESLSFCFSFCVSYSVINDAYVLSCAGSLFVEGVHKSYICSGLVLSSPVHTYVYDFAFAPCARFACVVHMNIRLMFVRKAYMCL